MCIHIARRSTYVSGTHPLSSLDFRLASRCLLVMYPYMCGSSYPYPPRGFLYRMYYIVLLSGLCWHLASREHLAYSSTQASCSTQDTRSHEDPLSCSLKHAQALAFEERRISLSTIWIYLIHLSLDVFYTGCLLTSSWTWVSMDLEPLSSVCWCLRYGLQLFCTLLSIQDTLDMRSHGRRLSFIHSLLLMVCFIVE
ncbi:hypothetical protein BDQ17DRAFT_1345933 [Cyathus striatus]|nr:hypothetical protein BDQ17DRAFT_1345933 [Cyathus striatus]